jgi:hypothetical protein
VAAKIFPETMKWCERLTHEVLAREGADAGYLAGASKACTIERIIAEDAAQSAAE